MLQQISKLLPFYFIFNYSVLRFSIISVSVNYSVKIRKAIPHLTRLCPIKTNELEQFGDISGILRQDWCNSNWTIDLLSNLDCVTLWRKNETTIFKYP